MSLLLSAAAILFIVLPRIPLVGRAGIILTSNRDVCPHVAATQPLQGPEPQALGACMDRAAGHLLQVLLPVWPAVLPGGAR